MERKPRLEGKAAIVTGAGSQDDEGVGNGRAAAILMAREGARVLLVDRRLGAAEATLAMIREAGGEAEAVAADVTVPADCEAMAARAMELWGRVDILDNNVGIGAGGSVVTASEESWERAWKVNVQGMVNASRAVVPLMAEAGGGSIINIASIAALLPSKLTPYATTKGAVISLTKAMAVDHGRDGIRVNCVAPGPVYTPMVYAAGMSDELRERRRGSSLLQVEGSGWDVGNAVLFLASDEARYITGVVLPVDGGVLLHGPSRH